MAQMPNADTSRDLITVVSPDTTVYLFTDTQAVQFLHSATPSVTCVRLSDASVICHVTYLQSPIHPAFLQYIAHQVAPEPYLWLWAAPALQQTTDDAENLGKPVSGAQHTAQGKDFEVIQTVKMETRGTIWPPNRFTFGGVIAHQVAPEPYLLLWAAPALQLTVGQYRTTDVRDIWVSPFLVRCIQPRGKTLK